MVRVQGSGIWFNLGKTISFQSHGQAYVFFNVTHSNPWPKNSTSITTNNEWMCFLAAKAGYDSIQFLREGFWPRDCNLPSKQHPKVKRSHDPLFRLNIPPHQHYSHSLKC